MNSFKSPNTSVTWLRDADNFVSLFANVSILPIILINRVWSSVIFSVVSCIAFFVSSSTANSLSLISSGVVACFDFSGIFVFGM